MLTIAASLFFALSLIGSVAVILMMAFGYRARIRQALAYGFDDSHPRTETAATSYRRRVLKPQQILNQHRSLQPATLRVAA